jgi:hypothetical protein
VIQTDALDESSGILCEHGHASDTVTLERPFPLEIGSRFYVHLVLESDGIIHRSGRFEEGPHIGGASDRARQH